MNLLCSGDTTRYLLLRKLILLPIFILLDVKHIHIKLEINVRIKQCTARNKVICIVHTMKTMTLMYINHQWKCNAIECKHGIIYNVRAPLTWYFNGLEAWPTNKISLISLQHCSVYSVLVDGLCTWYTEHNRHSNHNRCNWESIINETSHNETNSEESFYFGDYYELYMERSKYCWFVNHQVIMVRCIAKFLFVSKDLTFKTFNKRVSQFVNCEVIVVDVMKLHSNWSILIIQKESHTCVLLKLKLQNKNTHFALMNK